MTERRDLLVAWIKWDGRPSPPPKAHPEWGPQFHSPCRPETTDAVEDAVQAVAPSLGLSATELRSKLISLRRDGMTRAEAVACL